MMAGAAKQAAGFLGIKLSVGAGRSRWGRSTARAAPVRDAEGVWFGWMPGVSKVWSVSREMVQVSVGG